MGDPAIQVDGLVKHFGNRLAVGGVSFSVGFGEIFGFLGPNGAGKTTTISMLAGMLRPDSGSALMAGEAAGSPRARSKVGVVPQEIALYDELSAQENLHFFGGLCGLGGRALASRATAVLEMIGLSDRSASKVGTFSGGMKRRLNIGAALVHDPDIMLLDEPTAGVDPQSRSHIFATVESLSAAGKAVLYTTHYMEEVERLCSRIAIMDEGKILAEGTLVDLLDRAESRPKHRFSVPAGSASVAAGVLGVQAAQGAQPVGGYDFVEAPADGGALHERISALESAGIRVFSAELVRPNLEWLFLEMTGRKLRD